MPTVRDFASLSSEDARTKYKLGADAQDWKVSLAQDDLAKSELNDSSVTSVQYRPFDIRYTYYTGTSRGFICRPRSEVMRHTLEGINYGLIFMRQVALHESYTHFGVSRSIVDNRAFYSNKGIMQFAPLYTYPSEQSIEQRLFQRGERQPNLAPAFTAELERRLSLRFISDGKGDLRETFGPEDVFHYIYAMFHSPTYRERYDQFLRADFPRVPLVDDAESFRVLAGLGAQLTGIHLLESSMLDKPAASFPVPGDNVIEKGYPKYYAPDETPPGETTPVEQGRVYISANAKKGSKQGQYFNGIAPEVWEFRIGGYQPMDKWLKDRKGRELSFDDKTHYAKMAAALQETIRLMEEVDQAISNCATPWQWETPKVAS